MKAIKCEMCGSSDFVKANGYFVCQNCGTKYTVEEAKKMMIEGTVKIDTTEELNNLYQLARRARSDNNTENAEKYYNQIIVKDPSNWEANFYSTYYQSMNCKISQIESAAIRLTSCEDTIITLIIENILDLEERKQIIKEIGSKLIQISSLLFNAAKKDYDETDFDIKSEFIQEFIDNGCATRDIVYNFGDYLINFFGEEFGKDVAVPCWKAGIKQHNILLPYFLQKETNKQIIEEYKNKIKKYDPSYQEQPLSKPEQSEGCYIATCVYGSYDCPQVWTLRRYRDYKLAETWHGRIFIRLYYAISPTLVKWFGKTKWFKKLWKGKLDRMVANLQKNGMENTPYEDINWR